MTTNARFRPNQNWPLYAIENDAILLEFNVTCTLAHGTLLGSYVMHDILPWDDVLHLFVHIDDLPKMQRMFNATVVGHYIQIQLLECRSKHALTIKLFWTTDPRTGGQAWHWPCLDIAFNKTETREYVPTKTG